MRWFVRPFFTNNTLDAILVIETANSKITSAHGIIFEDPPELWGFRHHCGGELPEPKEWQPVQYDVFQSLGGDMNNRIIRLVDKGYIGRTVSWVQREKLIPKDKYCKYCAKENRWCEPIIGTDKKLYCNSCLRLFDKPVPFKISK